MPEPMFSRTGSEDFPSYMKCMISGPPKSGKTNFLGTVPNIVIADTEPHANNLATVAHLDIPFKAIRDTNDLRSLQFVLSNDELRSQAATALGLPAVEAVAIDTIDTLQGLMKTERMKEQRTNKFLRDDWGWLKEEMTAILQSYLNLPMHVFFVVHTKTKDVGTEENPRTIYLPGIEGSLAESIAGMVGYSLLSFRKEEIKPDGSGKYTKYWMRTEGDETYEYLGNRASGRLPDIIEPNFKTLLDAAQAGRPQKQRQAVPAIDIQTTGQTQQTQQPAAQQPAAQPAQQAVQAAPAAAPAEAPQAPPQEPAQNAGQQQPTGQPSGAGQAGDDEPVNAAALGFVKKVYDACEQSMPEEKIKALNLGQARTLVRTFKALQADAAEGKLGEGQTASSVMVEYLTNQDLLGGEQKQEPTVEPKVDGNIDQVQAYATDLAKVQEAYDLEMARTPPRTTLVAWLESKGAKPSVQTPVENPTAAPTDASTPAGTPETAVTPAATGADASPTEEQAINTVQEGLGGTVLDQEIRPDALCEECGNQIDDVDLAQLGKSRFNRVLCVTDYLAETKKPRG